MQHLIVTFGYVAIFALMLAESACIPVPSEVTMLFGGALASGAVSGTRLNIVVVIVAGTVGNVAGSYLAWAVGLRAGPGAVRRWGRHLRLNDDDVDRAQRWFARHGAASVFYARLLPVIRTFISLPAGFAAMPPVRFGLYTVAGCLPWTAALALIGYALGAKWQHVANGFHGPTHVIARLVAALLVAGFVVIWRRRRVVQEWPASTTPRHSVAAPASAVLPARTSES